MHGIWVFQSLDALLPHNASKFAIWRFHSSRDVKMPGNQKILARSWMTQLLLYWNVAKFYGKTSNSILRVIFHFILLKMISSFLSVCKFQTRFDLRTSPSTVPHQPTYPGFTKLNYCLAWAAALIVHFTANTFTSYNSCHRDHSRLYSLDNPDSGKAINMVLKRQRSFPGQVSLLNMTKLPHLGKI